MTKQKHTHKLRRLRYKSGNVVLFCALPDCNFKCNPPLAFGKRSICWRCGDEFIMNEYSIRLAKPHCMGCHKSKESKLVPYHNQTASTELWDRPESLSDRLLKLTGEQEEEL